ncbi:galactose-binding domain-like protein [Blastocladiella britannica]|nr:galactose-binding domain-like protein [Blastocladiella britannica]
MAEASQDLLADSRARIKASSVLNGDISAYGKAYLTDGRDDTCWNSEASAPQWILMDLGRVCAVHAIAITFQGGFVGTPMEVFADDGNGGAMQRAWTAHPADTNTPQRFPAAEGVITCRKVRIVFPASTDFYGRVTVYQLQVEGLSSEQ